MADPMAAQLAYDDIVAMTDEMLAATARWLPQFAAHWRVRWRRGS